MKIAPFINKMVEGVAVSDGEFESKSRHHFVRKTRENQLKSWRTRERSKKSRIKKVVIGLGVVISIVVIGVVLFHFILRPKI